MRIDSTTTSNLTGRTIALVSTLALLATGSLTPVFARSHDSSHDNRNNSHGRRTPASTSPGTPSSTAATSCYQAFNSYIEARQIKGGTHMYFSAADLAVLTQDPRVGGLSSGADAAMDPARGIGGSRCHVVGNGSTGLELDRGRSGLWQSSPRG